MTVIRRLSMHILSYEVVAARQALLDQRLLAQRHYQQGTRLLNAPIETQNPSWKPRLVRYLARVKVHRLSPCPILALIRAQLTT